MIVSTAAYVWRLDKMFPLGYVIISLRERNNF